MIHPFPPAPPHNATHRAAALRRAAVQAAQAPSVLNTQPWKLRIRDGALYIHADHRRQLAALDPQRRVLTTSVGCAVFNARASLAADGYGVEVRRFPDPLVSDLAAVIVPNTTVQPDPAPDLGADWLTELGHLLAADGVHLHVLDELERGLVAELNRQADEIENLDPTYRAELDAWSTTGDRARVSEAHECLAVLVTDGDDPLDWLRAGEATMRALQSAAAAGQQISPSSQVIEVASARAQLRRALGFSGHAHMLLQLGRAASANGIRRRLVDVLVEES